MAKNIDPTLQPLPSVDELDNLARSDIDQWRKLIVTGGAGLPFGSSTGYEAHPLRAYFQNENTDGKTHYVYRGLMALVAEHLGLIDPSGRDADVMTVHERVVEVLMYHLDGDLAEKCASHHRAEKQPRRLDWYMFCVIEHLTDALSVALSDVAYDVAAGVPLYRLAESRAGDVMVKDHEQPSAYLIGKAMHHDSTSFPTRLPAWADGHGFRRSDIEAFKLIFGGEFHEMSPEQFAARRAALRKHIGGAVEESDPSTSAPSAASAPRSKLMTELDEVRSRYYSRERFSLANRDTWPKQTTIVGWLREERGLTEREAMAVDVVARPDEIRGK